MVRGEIWWKRLIIYADIGDEPTSWLVDHLNNFLNVYTLLEHQRP